MRRLVVIALGIACTGCLTLSETNLTAGALSAPVSLSQSYVDAAGTRRTPAPDEIVGHFQHTWRHWEMAWGFITLTDHFDLEGYLREQLEAQGGDAVVNLMVRSDFGASYLVTSLLFIFPESVQVTVEGDIVRERNPES